MRAYIQEEIAGTLEMLENLRRNDAVAAETERIVQRCCAALRGGHKILIAGNGGSAADAQHLATELVGRFKCNRPGLPAVALNSDTALLTAIGNDYGYEFLFARQLDALGTAGVVFIAISTSGRSPNIIRALEEARRKGISTVGLMGSADGNMTPLCDFCIRIPSADTAKIQEGHIVIGHILCGLIEQELFVPESQLHAPLGGSAS